MRQYRTTKRRRHRWCGRFEVGVAVWSGRGISITPDLCVINLCVILPPAWVLKTRTGVRCVEPHMSRCRRYAWTLHDYTQMDEECVQGLNVKYVVYGREVCPDTGRPHLQGYLELFNAKTLLATKKMFNNNKVHLEPAKGNSEQNKNYCVKDNNFYERGEISQKQGQRNDIENIREMVDKEKNMREILDTCSNFQQIRIAEKLLTYKEKPRTWKPQVLWFYGSTGSGKSREAFQILDNPYVATSSIKWWDGYDAHENVIIDDMRKDFAKFHDLLRLLDRYEYRVEYKGGYRQFLAKKIIITTAYHPSVMYDTREDVGQLLRRIDEIRFFSVE